MGAPASRRGFLHGLATLPLIGGSVALIGAPTATAEPVTKALLDSYDAWLEYERRWLQYERHGSREVTLRLSLPFASEIAGWDQYDVIPHGNAGAGFHRSNGSSATSRAALVLSAVGCEWGRS